MYTNFTRLREISWEVVDNFEVNFMLSITLRLEYLK